MVFRNGRRYALKENWYLGKHIILEVLNESKYLGILLMPQLLMGNHFASKFWNIVTFSFL